MGYPAVTEMGPSRTDATRARHFAPTPSGATIPVQLSLNRYGPLFFSARRASMAQPGNRARGTGESPAKKQRAVCAARLVKNRTVRASRVFTGVLNPAPITRESPLRQSADYKKPAVSLSRPQILELKEWRATILSSRVE